MRNLPLIVIVLVIGFGIGYFLNGSNEQAVEQEASMEEASTSTLAAVKEKGYVQCGVSQGLPDTPTQMTMVTGQGLMLIFAAVLPLLSLVMLIKSVHHYPQNSVLPRYLQ